MGDHLFPNASFYQIIYTLSVLAMGVIVHLILSYLRVTRTGYKIEK